MKSAPMVARYPLEKRPEMYYQVVRCKVVPV
jgi:hypothetical protein